MEIPKKLYIITLAFLCNHFPQFLRFVRNRDVKGKRLLWKYLKIEKEVFANCNGINFKLNLNDDIQQEIYMNTYEKVNMKFVLSLIKTGDTFFDVGANVGAYTLHAAKKLNKGENIYAFEPEPNNLERLKINCSLNDFSNSVNIFPLALTNYIGTASLYKSQNTHSGWHSLNEFKDVSIGKVEVNTATLDSVISKLNLKEVDLIKIDIEANEFELLEGADNSLKEKIFKRIFIEFNGARLAEKNKSFNDFINLFKQYGYTPRKFNMHLVGALQNGKLNQAEICENFLFEPV